MTDEAQQSPALGRIQQRLQDLGLSERGASMQAFGHGSAIRNLRTGATRDPGVYTLEKLADVLQVTPEWLAFGVGGGQVAGEPANSNLFLPVTGEVAAGQFREHDGSIDHPVYDPIPVPYDPRWPKEAQFALITRGTSVNRVALDGDYLSCVDAKMTRYTPREGELVIVEQRKYGGHMIERTAKRFHRNGSLIELHPDSTDSHSPIIIDPSEPEEGTEIDVIAFVAWVHRSIVNGSGTHSVWGSAID